MDAYGRLEERLEERSPVSRQSRQSRRPSARRGGDKENARQGGGAALGGLMLAGAACVGASLANQFRLWQTNQMMQGLRRTN
jgi:hypothetical protein